jgi:hypothetical protein
MFMNTNNSDLNQLALQKIQPPLLRIAYKNEEVVENRETKPARKSKNVKAAIKPAIPTVKTMVKEPLPMFNDYRFKAKDHDPL